MLVRCYNIKYAEKEKPITVTSGALSDWLYHSEKSQPEPEPEGERYLDFDSEEAKRAPSKCEIDVILFPDWIDNIEETEEFIKRQIEQKIGYKIKSFDFTVVGG